MPSRSNQFTPEINPRLSPATSSSILLTIVPLVPPHPKRSQGSRRSLDAAIPIYLDIFSYSTVTFHFLSPRVSFVGLNRRSASPTKSPFPLSRSSLPPIATIVTITAHTAHRISAQVIDRSGYGIRQTREVHFAPLSLSAPANELSGLRQRHFVVVPALLRRLSLHNLLRPLHAESSSGL
ncbi:hypothetical protein DTO169E5_2166 [Paecilomyces variotii]|nr:hypothetical protein DTO169E5_2166 [Paecilomyces variotii]